MHEIKIIDNFWECVAHKNIRKSNSNQSIVWRLTLEQHQFGSV